MKNNKPLEDLLNYTSAKGYSRFIRFEFMNALSGSEEEKQKQVELFTSIVETSKTEKEAIQRIREVIYRKSEDANT